MRKDYITEKIESKLIYYVNIAIITSNITLI